MNNDHWLKKGLVLFLFFFKIGCFTFGGGWAILAQTAGPRRSVAATPEI